MADLSPKERLFPSLLDRLTDDRAGEKTETRERRVFSVHKLRAAVLRDLAWLLNTCHLAATEDLEQYPSIEKSVLNYGIPDLTGKTLSGMDVVDIERELRQSILNYEPRIIADTLQVRANANEWEASANSLTFEIEGELWARPFPERLYLKTELDLESGSVSINEV